MRFDERGDGRVAGERHRAGHRFEHGQAQRVHVALRTAHAGLGELRSGVHRQRVADMGSIGPQRLADDVGETDVGDSQPLVVAEHQGRGTNVAVHQAVAMDDVERLARLETDHQCLRRRQRAATIEVLAQAAATEVLDDDVHRLALVPGVGTPVVDLGDVGMLDRGALLGGQPERPLEALARAEVGMDDLDRHDTLIDQVKGIENSSVDTTAAARSELIATRHDPTVELCIHHCHGVLNATATRAPWAFMCEIAAWRRMREE